MYSTSLLALCRSIIKVFLYKLNFLVRLMKLRGKVWANKT